MQKTANGGHFLHASITNALTFFLNGFRSFTPRKSGRYVNCLPAQMKRVMRLLTILLFTACLSAAAGGTAQSITISGENLTIKEVFATIKKQTGFVMAYAPELFRGNKRYSFDIKAMPLRAFLDMIIKEQALKYDFQGKTIFISQKSGALFPVATLNQSEILSFLPITGVVKDASGNPLAGATVRVQGKTISTVTDGSGRFKLTVNEGDLLIVTFVGFEKQTFVIKATTAVIDVTMKASDNELLEVVVNKGYYTESQRLSTGNVSRVTAKEIANQPVLDPLAALQGRVPGLIVSQSSGVPGGSLKVQLRGRTAIDREITDDQPLFVIDGVPTANNNGFLNQFTSALGYPTNSVTATIPGGLSPFSSLNPQDIESIEVLKDADATSIYGSRGSNGVILITTKRGSSGASKVFVNASTGWSKASKTVDWMNTKQYLAMRREAFANDGVIPTESNAFDLLVWDTTRYTDFKKLLIGGTARTTDVQAGISGGNQQTQFRLSGAYRNETTVFPGDWNVGRITSDANIQHQSVNQKFRLQFSTNYGASTSLLPTNDLAQSVNLIPHLQLYDDDGNLAWNEGGYRYGENPLAALLASIYKVKTDNLNANLQLQYRVLPDLTVRTSLGYNSIVNQEHKTYARASQNPISTGSGSAYFANNNFKSWIGEAQLNYRKTIGNSDIQVLAGGSMQRQNGYTSSISGSGYTSDQLLFSLAGANAITASNASSEYRYMAFFGRALYNYKQRYLINFSARRDGSSRFGPGRQFANFGAIGAAWIFSDEAFMKGTTSWLSFGKLRGSYGTTGNDKIPNYQYLDTYETMSHSRYQDSSTLRPYKLFNPDYHWEATSKLELALELGFLQDKLIVSASWYRNISSNQLINYKLPFTTGFTSVVANFPAKVRNSGLELSVQSTNWKTQDWQWNTSLNITIPRNKLISFPNLENSSYYYSYREGYPLNLIYAYRYMGVDPANGYYLMEDVNNDKKLSSRDDYQPLGVLDPAFYGGLQNSLRFKGWEFTAFFDFRKQLGSSIMLWSHARPGIMGNMPVTVLDRWQNPGDNAMLMRFTQQSSNGISAPYVRDLTGSNGNYTDASFVKLRNVSLSYTFPSGTLQRVKIEGIRVYLLAQNLWTITGYQGADPEIQSLRRLAPMQTITGGVQINL